jgi:hypothetical protein
VDGDPTQDITILQKKKLLDMVIKGGRKVDLTPAPNPRRWYFERHKIFLNGKFDYDEDAGRGVLVP